MRRNSTSTSSEAVGARRRVALVAVNLTVRAGAIAELLDRNEGPTLEWHWRRRLEVMTGQPGNKWWRVEDGATANASFEEIRLAMGPLGFALMEKLGTMVGWVDELSHDRPSGLTAIQRLSVLSAGQAILGEPEAVAVTLAKLREAATPMTAGLVTRYIANMVANGGQE